MDKANASGWQDYVAKVLCAPEEGGHLYVVEIAVDGIRMRVGDRLYSSAQPVVGNMPEFGTINGKPLTVEQLRNVWNASSGHSSVVTEKALRSFYWRITGRDAV